MSLIGAHVDSDDPLAAARERGAEVVQFFLTDPQSFKAPTERADTAALAQARTAIFVHAPYVINVASLNNRVRIPSRALLDTHARAAAAIGARGLIVHGGHVRAGEDPERGVANWRKVFERAAEHGGFPVPVLIENTAGGEHAMARRFDRLARLWDAIGEFGPGFCLDTCHAHAAGEDLADVVDRVRAITGRIDLVHLNDSRDPFGSGRDRHANIGAGQIDPDLLVGVVAEAGAPAVCETPGGAAEHAADISFLRSRLRDRASA